MDMNAITLLSALKQRGHVLECIGDRLRVRPMKGLTDDELAMLTKYRDEMVELLNSEHLPELLLSHEVTQQRKSGQVPAHYRFEALCKQCGPIWLYAPGTYEACPWCHNRYHNRPIPRPTRACSDESGLDPLCEVFK